MANFDFCESFEFFQMSKGKLAASQTTLQGALLKLNKLQDLVYQTSELIAFRQDLVADMVRKAQELNSSLDLVEPNINACPPQNEGLSFLHLRGNYAIILINIYVHKYFVTEYLFRYKKRAFLVSTVLWEQLSPEVIRGFLDS